MELTSFAGARRGGRGRFALWAVLGVLAAAYLVQAGSPLRINYDVAALLSLSMSLADGHGMRVHGAPTHYPVGYPAMVAGLDRAGLANRVTLVGLNLVWLAAGLAAFFSLCRRGLGLPRERALAACCLALSSWVVIKHVTLAVSDIVFLGVMLVAMWLLRLFEDARGPRKGVWLVLAALGVALAVLVRTVGVALVPVLVWAALGARRGHVLPV